MTTDFRIVPQPSVGMVSIEAGLLTVKVDMGGITDEDLQETLISQAMQQTRQLLTERFAKTARLGHTLPLVVRDASPELSKRLGVAYERALSTANGLVDDRITVDWALRF